jgi:murein DD-endopeptidase MepM/ murein hydrolase activator NlpD
MDRFLLYARSIIAFGGRWSIAHKYMIVYGLFMFSLGVFTANQFIAGDASFEEAADEIAIEEVVEDASEKDAETAKTTLPVFKPENIDKAEQEDEEEEDVFSSKRLAALITPTPKPRQADHTVDMKVGRGDTLTGLLQRAGVGRNDAYLATAALKDVFDVRSLRAGTKMEAQFVDGDDGGMKFVGLFIEKPDHRIVVSRKDDVFSAKKEVKKLKARVSRKGGVIDSSLFNLSTALEVPVGVMMEVINAYSYDVDFQRDIQGGNRFEVMYETIYDEEGNKVRDGDVLFATLTVQGADLTIFRYEDKDGDIEYFGDDGQSVRKALLKTPINGARISSRYGLRKHPISGYSKMHKGVDFAAPTGTPVYAAGDGVIESIGRNGGYGNYVRIRHSNYSTAYAHLNGYAKGMKRGRRVKQGQVIAYVGTTGRSTGPHLHYEVIRAGKQINPMKLKMTPGEKLKGTRLAKFDRVKKRIIALRESLPRPTRLASTR